MEANTIISIASQRFEKVEIKMNEFGLTPDYFYSIRIDKFGDVQFQGDYNSKIQQNVNRLSASLPKEDVKVTVTASGYVTTKIKFPHKITKRNDAGEIEDVDTITTIDFTLT